MKLFRRYPRRNHSAVRERAENVNRAAVLLQRMRPMMSDADYETLFNAIRHEIDAVARELRP